jgi:hypothetical protein
LSTRLPEDLLVQPTGYSKKLSVAVHGVNEPPRVPPLGMLYAGRNEKHGAAHFGVNPLEPHTSSKAPPAARSDQLLIDYAHAEIRS